MTDSATPAAAIEDCFRVIRETRMDGIPILNAALSVRVVGMRRWNEHWLAVLLTPWFMNVMLLSEDGVADAVPAGTKRIFRFPAGPFEFISGEEAAIGRYWMCSLFSPVLEFADQETAEATAAIALEELFADAESATPELAEQESEARPERLSRRMFLSGSLRPGAEQ